MVQVHRPAPEQGGEASGAATSPPPAATRHGPAVRNRLWLLAGGLGFSLALGACGSTEPSPEPAGARTNPGPTATSTRWTPSPGASWQWQLSGRLDLGVEAEIFDVDYEKTTATEVDALKQKGRQTICYLSVGSREDFRGDANHFPASVRGSTMSGWPDEQWLDIRRMDVLLPIMAARMDICADKGFDAVEADNVDGYLNETGFPLDADDQLAYNRAVAKLAHERGLSVALKNDVDQIAGLVGDFDFAINEECARYDECGLYKPFTDAGKAVLHVEYRGDLSFCAESGRSGFSSMLKPPDLSAPRSSC